MKMSFGSVEGRQFIRPLIGLGLATCLPIMQTYVFNIDELMFFDILNPLALAIFGVVLCFALSFLLFRSSLKSELICYVVIAFVWLYLPYARLLDDGLYYFFGFGFDFKFGRTLLLLSWGLLFVLGCLYVYKRAQTLVPLAKVLPFVILLFYGELAVFAYSENKTVAKQTYEQVPEDLSKALSAISPTSSTEQLPDIYFIVLDGYTGQDVLQESYNFDNSPFLEELEELGFIVPTNSHSNYGLTFLSLTTAFNLRYLNDWGLSGTDRTVLDRMCEEDSFVVDFLQHYDYLFENASMPSRDAEDAKEGLPFGSIELNFVLMEKTIFQPFYDKFFIRSFHDKIMNANLDRLRNSYKIQGRKFVFVHVGIPHPPHYFDKDGLITTPGDVSRKWSDVDGYVGSVQYINKRLLPILEEIITQSPIKPVIILQADHGPLEPHSILPDSGDITQRQLRTEGGREWEGKISQRWSILNAVYLQGEQFTDVPTTPVNNFRYIFKKYFDAPIELLPNKMYYSTYEEPYKFLDITDDLLQGNDFYMKDLSMMLKESDNKAQ